MTLSRNELQGLMHLLGLTREEEIDCDQCLPLVAEFAEHQLAGKSLPEALYAVEHHLSVCGDCREEYELLQQVLKDMGKENR